PARGVRLDSRFRCTCGARKAGLPCRAQAGNQGGIMRGVITGAAAACALALAPSALAGNIVLYPNSVGAHTVASWRAHEGQPDTVGAANQALWLEKDDGGSADYAAATVRGLEGERADSLVG